MLNGKKILITGATGFIGANITRAFLKKGAKVHIFTRTVSNKWRIRDILSDVTEHSIDLLDKDELKQIIPAIKPDIIIHNAVYGGYPWQNDSMKIRETNITGTKNLLTACKKFKFEIFINTSSSSEYGIKDKPMSEEDTLRPTDEYGKSSALATSFCREVALKEGRPIVTLRLFSPYGYFEEKSRLVPSVIISCLKEENPKVSSPEPVRDFIFIEDVISAYVKTIKNSDKVKGEVFNVGYGRQHSVGEVVNKIIELTGNKVMPEWGGVVNPRIEPPKMWQSDISKVKKNLKWQPRYNLNQGLRKTANWLRKNMVLYG